LRLEQIDQAVFSFGNVLSIDDSRTDAWVNLANCYGVQKKYE
jgi:tetratricopeptide (TPR) repeat protein